MGIQQTGATFYKKSEMFGYAERSWVCTCDFCGTKAYKTGEDPGNCADRARKNGFTTVRTSLSAPSMWACGSCSKYQKQKSSLTQKS